MNNLKRKVQEQFSQAANDATFKIGTGIGLTVATPLAMAAVDVSAAVTEIGLAAAAVALIGAAVIIVKVGVKLYKWAAAAL